MPNNVVYGATAVALLVGGYYAYQNGWLSQLPIIGAWFAPAMPTNVVVSPATVPQGTGATATGAFNPPAPSGYYNVTNATGGVVLSGTLGSNVSTFTQALATQSLPPGTYTLTISDQPLAVGTGAGGGSGQILVNNTQLSSSYVPTAFTKNMSAAPGEGASGPTNITLSG